MKCINCNNEIPDGSLVCPICSSKVGNAGTGQQFMSAPTDTSVLPTVPETPTLPIDQKAIQEAIASQPVENAAQSAVINQGVTPEVGAAQNVQHPQVTETSQVQPQVTMQQTAIENLNQGNLGTDLNQTPPMQTQAVNTNVGAISQQGMPVNNLEGTVQNVQQTQMSQPVLEPQVNPTNPTVQGNESVQAQPLVNDINPEFIAPNGESIKLGNTKAVEDALKAKRKKNLIIILIIVLVLVVISVLGFLYYSSQYKSADKRVDAIVNTLFKSSRTINNDIIDKTSGSYNVDLAVSSNDSNFGAKLNGTYATDLSGKAIDVTLNLTSLIMNEELVDSPINLELYLNESRAYLLFQNYYHNYIYQDVEGLQTLFEANEQNNIDYMSMISALKSAIGAGIKGMHSTQSVGSANIHGETKKSNIIRINFNENNQAIFNKRFFNSLANNSKFVSEGAKLSDISEDEFKNKLLDNANAEIKPVQNANIEIYTSMFKEELHGLRISSNTDDGLGVFELYPTVNGYGASYKVGSQNVFEGTYENNTKSTSTTRESTTVLDFSFYNDSKAYKVNLTFENVRDVNPKDARVNVKNSINKKYLPEEDKQTLLNAAASSGKIGLYLPSIIGAYLNDGVTITTPDMNQDIDGTDSCSSVTNCVESGIEGYLTCTNTLTNEQVTCPVN